ncbi:MAG: hypothetical protein V4608_09915 [Bacteroidota bacterium]
MKRTILILISVISYFAIVSCGGSENKKADESALIKVDTLVKGYILGIGKYWYEEKGNNYYRVCLKIQPDNEFNGDILFKDNGSDPLATGILTSYKESTDFNPSSLFKKVKLTLEPASKGNLKNAYFVSKLEFIKSEPYKILNAELVEDVNSLSKWEPIGDELHPKYENFAVTKLSVCQDKLFAFSGVFTAGVGFSLGYLGDENLKGMQVLNNNKWESEGLDIQGVVLTAMPLNNQLYIGGKFNTKRQPRTYAVALYDSLGWSTVGSPSPFGETAKVLSIEKYKNEVYVGGDIGGGSGENFSEGIARWNGTSWNSVGIGKKSDYANKLSNGLPGLVRTLTVYNDELYAGGDFMTADGKFVHGITRWNGQDWRPVGLGVDGSVWSLAVYKNELYAAGKFTNVGGVPAQSLAKWDGKDWTVISLPIQLSSEELIKTIYVHDGMLYIAGKFIYSSETFDIKNIMKFDGNKLYPVGTPEKLTEASNKVVYGFSGVINTLVTYKDELCVGGQFSFTRDHKVMNGIAKLGLTNK